MDHRWLKIRYWETKGTFVSQSIALSNYYGYGGVAQRFAVTLKAPPPQTKGYEDKEKALEGHV